MSHDRSEPVEPTSNIYTVDRPVTMDIEKCFYDDCEIPDPELVPPDCNRPNVFTSWSDFCVTASCGDGGEVVITAGKYDGEVVITAGKYGGEVVITAAKYTMGGGDYNTYYSIMGTCKCS